MAINQFSLRDYRTDDTICAIATFPSRSALGVIKVSGKEALNIVSKIFKPARAKDIRRVKTFTIHYGWIIERPKACGLKVNPGEGRTRRQNKVKIIDEVLVSVMRKPHSYTTEDVVEISCHGGIVVLNRVLELLMARGCRLAQPGEFSYRAVLGGRINALQAESIASIVDAKTDDALAVAASQLRGNSSGPLIQIKSELKDVFIETESFLNFPDDVAPLSKARLAKRLSKIMAKVQSIQEGSHKALMFREGLRCVICGRTNAGKSTLFNRLLGQERVIVSQLHGTTRDVIEETINIRGLALRIYDTAGIFKPQDSVSKLALQKAQAVFKEADLVVLLIDGSRKPNKDDLFLLQRCRDKDTILVINKIDLPQKCRKSDFSFFKGKCIEISALKNRGLACLEKEIYHKLHRLRGEPKDLVFLSAYQRQMLDLMRSDLEEAQRFLANGYSIDFVNILLKNCLDAIGKITGEVLSEEVLESIFSKFCIGK